MVLDDDRAAVLIVDDSPANVFAISTIVSELADEVVTAQSGAQALRRLLERDFAVLLLDVSMPGMDGYQTARLIRSRARNRQVPIIFLTAYNRDEYDVLEAYRLGAVDFLFKPIQAEVLRAKVRVFVELRRSTVEVARQAKRLDELRLREHQQALEAQRRAIETAAMARLIEEERRTTRRLADIDRRKDEFLAVLGHELRTPLAAMVTGVALLSTATASEECRADALQAIERQLGHLNRLVDDLLDVARIRSGRITLRKERLVLADVVHRAVELSRQAILERRHELILSLPEDPVYVDADAVRIVQSLANLLHNAARYTDEGGCIEVTATTTGDRAVVVVKDNGPGLAADALESIFDIFVQVTGGNRGLGLGLPLARQLVECHGGTLVAHSEGAGRGSTFELSLPLPTHLGQHVLEEAVLAVEPVAAPAPCRVLIVEDDADLRATLSHLVRSWGHDVTVAATGSEGLRQLCELRPDVALVDIGLPDIDGCDVVERARDQLDGATRLVALTGYTQDADRRRITAAGFHAHLSKPPDLESLRHTLLPLS